LSDSSCSSGSKGKFEEAQRGGLKLGGTRKVCKNKAQCSSKDKLTHAIRREEVKSKFVGFWNFTEPTSKKEISPPVHHRQYSHP
jgi:hypothetical protein